MKLLFWTSFWVFLADQLSKYIVVHWMGLINESDGLIPVIPGFVEFRMAWNRGVNFGLFADFDMKWVLIAVALAITLAVILWLWKTGTTKLGYIAGGFLVGGALGNVIDRFLYDAVADFLNVTCCGIYNPYAFNVADIAIFIGAIGLAFVPDNAKPKPKRKKPS